MQASVGLILLTAIKQVVWWNTVLANRLYRNCYHIWLIRQTRHPFTEYEAVFFLPVRYLYHATHNTVSPKQRKSASCAMDDNGSHNMREIKMKMFTTGFVKFAFIYTTVKRLGCNQIYVIQNKQIMVQIPSFTELKLHLCHC